MSSSRIHSLFTMTNSVTHRRLDGSNQQNLTFRTVLGAGSWWSQTGSNRRPEACKATALPTELWPRLAPHGARKLVGLGGLEPPTSRLSSARSNQLSYRPKGMSPETRRLETRPKNQAVGPEYAAVAADAATDQAYSPGKERETKTAKFRMSKPDWLLCSKRI